MSVDMYSRTAYNVMTVMTLYRRIDYDCIDSLQYYRYNDNVSLCTTHYTYYVANQLDTVFYITRFYFNTVHWAQGLKM